MSCRQTGGQDEVGTLRIADTSLCIITSMELPELSNTDELNIIIIGLGDEDVDIALGLRVPYNRPKMFKFQPKRLYFLKFYKIGLN